MAMKYYLPGPPKFTQFGILGLKIYHLAIRPRKTRDIE
jgi:hypothetical protein